MNLKRFLTGSLALTLVAGAGGVFAQSSDRTEAARRLAAQVMIVDTHIDVPYRLEEEWEDVTEATEDGDFDYVRATQGAQHPVHVNLHVG